MEKWLVYAFQVVGVEVVPRLLRILRTIAGSILRGAMLVIIYFVCVCFIRSGLIVCCNDVSPSN
jgi:hypothetical protein